MKYFLTILTLCFTFSAIGQDCLLPNGGFEDWLSNDRPQFWNTTNIAGNEGQANAMSGYDWRNVFKTPGKIGSGIRMINVSVADFIKEKKPQEWAKLPAYMKEQLRNQGAFSSTLVSCESKDCNKLVAGQNQGAIYGALVIDIPKGSAPGYLKGWYKAKLKPGDKLWILPILLDGNEQPTGGVKPGRTENVIQKNVGQWTQFTIPLDYFPKRMDKTQKLMLQIQMVGRDFPSANPAGMNPVALGMKYASQDGSEISLDELCFGGQGTEVDPDDPSLIGNGGGSGTGTGTGDDSGNDIDDILYIATTGSDGNSGSSSSPFATIRKALIVAKGKLVQGKPVKIIVRNGTYRQEATVDFSGGNLPPLIIEAENKHEAIFIGSEPITENANWRNQGGTLYLSSVGVLHPDQKPIFDASNYSNPMETSVPALVVNGTQLKHQQGGDLQNVPSAYVYSPQLFMVNPGSASLTSASIEVSVRENAIQIANGGAVTVKGLRLKGFPQASIPQLNEQQMPGLDGVSAVDCLYE